MHSIFMVLAGALLVIGVPGDSPRGSAATQGETAVEMKVKGVTIDQRSQQPVVVLVDLAGKKALPIWIGPAEARAIAMDLEGMSSPRPMTHDLIINILSGLNLHLERITVTDLKDETFYALLSLKGEGGPLLVDCRPSDAIALALKVNAPIYVRKNVLAAAQMISLTNNLPRDTWMEGAGIHAQELTPELIEYFHIPPNGGLLVVDVGKGSPGEKAGLLQGDIITSVDKAPVATLDALSSSLTAPGGSHSLTVQREGRTLTVTVTP